MWKHGARFIAIVFKQNGNHLVPSIHELLGSTSAVKKYGPGN